jgi:CHAT domain-containing protein
MLAVRRACSILLISIFLLVGVKTAQAGSALPEGQTQQASQLFLQGKARQAADVLRAAISEERDPFKKGILLRDLLQVCSEASHWDCVETGLKELSDSLQSEPRLRAITPDFLLYANRFMTWHGGREELAQFVSAGGAAAVAGPSPHAALYSLLELSTHDLAINNMDYVTAERVRSMAMFGLMMPSTFNSYFNSQAIIELLEAQLVAQDIEGAILLLTATEAFIASNVPQTSILYARYLYACGQLLSYGNSYDIAADLFVRSSALWSELEVGEEAKLYSVSLSNNLAVASLVLAGKLSQAKEVHSRHPLQKEKSRLLAADGFENYSAFFFAITDVFIEFVTSQKPDESWRRVFKSDGGWVHSKMQNLEYVSYRDFALGMIDLAAGHKEEGREALIRSAQNRIDNFHHLLKATLEGFPMPGLVDKLVINFGLSAAVAKGGNSNVELMLQGSEVLSRNLRHRLVDVAVLLSTQPNVRSKRDAHSYVHLVERKKSWETERLRSVLYDGKSKKDAGDIVVKYGNAVSSLSNLKQRVRNQAQSDLAGIPTVEEVRSLLGENEVYVGYFAFSGGFGKYCVRKGISAFSAGSIDAQQIVTDAKTLADEASKFPRSRSDLTSYPVKAAVSLNRALFGGLEECLTPGSEVVVALPHELSSLPLAALLSSEPEQKEGQYDLSSATWLIRDFSLSQVLSPRHLVVTRRSVDGIAERDFLGVGDPNLDAEGTRKLAATRTFRGSLKTPHGVLDFSALPETAAELKSAAKLFPPSRVDILLGLEGTEQKFRSLPLGTYNVIHFATHGLAGGDVKGMAEGALILTPGDPADPFNDGLLTSSEIAKLSLSARVAILSACNTAKYSLQEASRNIHDLQAAFIVAGVPTVIGSLWPVNSRTTEQQISLLLSHWIRPEQPGLSTALAAATREFLATAPKWQQHPAYWAAFNVVGNGSVKATDARHKRSIASSTLSPLPEYHSGGEIVGGQAVDDGLVLAIQSEWDGKKMNGITEKRDASGKVVWRVGSREVGIGKLTVNKGKIFVTGVRTDSPHIPVVRVFDEGGRELHVEEFSAVPDYSPFDIIPFEKGAAVAMVPIGNAGAKPNVLIAIIDESGKIARQTTVPLSAAEKYSSVSAILGIANNSLLVAVGEDGMQREVRWKQRVAAGLPAICKVHWVTTVHQLSLETLQPSIQIPIRNFTPYAFAEGRGNFYLGGETGNGCSQPNVGSVWKISGVSEAMSYWTDDDIFSSSVKSIFVTNDGLTLGLEHTRALGLAPASTTASSIIDDLGSKRWGDVLDTKTETTLVEIGFDGNERSRKSYDAGFSMFLAKMVRTKEGFAGYGSLGGVPTVIRTYHDSFVAGLLYGAYGRLQDTVARRSSQ